MNKEEMLKIGFKKEVELVNQNRCPFCKQQIDINDFKDLISQKEYGISGLCLKCQNNLFGAE